MRCAAAVVALSLLACVREGGAKSQTESCDAVSSAYHGSIKAAITNFNVLLGTAQSRLSGRSLQLIGAGQSLSFVNTQLGTVSNYTLELSNLLDDLNDVSVSALNEALPTGANVTCNVGLDVANVYVSLALNVTGTHTLAVDLSGLPAADMAALGLSIADPAVALDVAVAVTGTLEVDVMIQEGTVTVRISDLGAVISASGSVSTSVAWKDVGTVGLSGAVALTGVTVPLVFPTGSVSDFLAMAGEVRLGTVSGALLSQLSVDVAVDAVPVGQLPSPVLTVNDTDIFDTTLPVVTVDMNISSLESTVVELLTQLGQFEIDLSALGLADLELPNVNVSDVLTGVSDLLKLAPAAEQYFLLFISSSSSAAEHPTFEGLAAFLRDNLPAPSGVSGSVSFDGVNITGGWYPEKEELQLNLQVELAVDVASVDFSGSIQNILGDMQALDVLFELIGASPPAASLEVPEMSASVTFGARVVLDITLGLKTEFLNTGKLTATALAGNAFVRVNDFSAAVSVEVDPINFEAELPLDSSLEVRDGTFRTEFGLRAAFDATTDEDDVDPDTPVTASTVAPVVEITVMQLLTGGTSAVLDFIKQLNLEVYASLDIVIPVELTSGFQGADLSVSPIVELHDDNLLSGGFPSFGLDVDLSLLVPSLPGGLGVASGGENHVADIMGSLTTLLDEISGISLPTASLPGAASLPDLLKSIGGALDFGTELDAYLDLLVRFRELDTGLSLDLSLDLRPAQLLLASDAFQLDMLGLLEAVYPTVFAGFTNGLSNPALGTTFSVSDYLQHFQVVFGVANTIASADASWSESDLICYISTHSEYALTPKNARAFVRALGLQEEYSAQSSKGYPQTAGGVIFDPAEHLDALQTAFGEGGGSAWTLGSLSAYLCSRTASFGLNTGFQKAIFALLSVRFPDITSGFSAEAFGDGLPYNPLTGDTFDWQNYLPQVGTVLGLGGTTSLPDIAGLLGKRPTIQGLVRFLKARVLDGLSTSLSIGGLSFSGGLATGSGGGMELSASVGLAFETPAVTATEVVASLEGALTGLFELIGVDSVIGSIGDIGAGLQEKLEGLDDSLTFAASVSITVEAGADISPLIDGAGSPLFYVRVTGFDFAVAANVTGFTTPLNFGDPFDFSAICGADIGFRASSSASADQPAVLRDDAAGITSFTLQPLTSSLSLTGSVVGNVELAGGPLDSSLYLGVEDYALFDDTPPAFTVDAEIPHELMVVLNDALSAVGDLGREVNSIAALSTTLPLMNRTLHDLLKTDGVGPDWGDFLVWDGALSEAISSSALYTDCLASSAGKCPTAREALSAFQSRMDYLTTASFLGEGNDTVPASGVRAGMVGDLFEMGFAVSGTLDIRVTPPLAELVDDDEIEFSGTSLLVVSVSFGLAVDVTVNTSKGLSSVTAGDITVQLHNLTMGMEIVADVSATAQLGLLAASIEGGEGLLEASFAGTLNGGAPTTLSDITSAKFSFVKAASLDACLPFSASIGQVDLGTISDDGSGSPQICVNDTDLFESPAPTVTTLHMSRLYDFRGLSPVQIMGIVRGLINTVQEYRESAVFDVSVPFTDLDLGDLLDFSDTLTAALYAKMVKVQDAADRTTLVLCVEGDTLPDGWATDGTEGRASFTDGLALKVFSVVLNEELQVELASLDASSIEGAASASDLASQLNAALYSAGLGLSVQASVVEGTDAIQLCTNESIAATDLRIGVGLKQTGNTAYNESTTAYAPSAMLGFSDGAVKEAPRVPAFSSIPDLAAVLAEALSNDIVTITYAPRSSSPTQYELLFDVSLPLTLPSPTASLTVGAEVEPLLQVNASAQISLTTQAALGFSFGARMGQTAGNLSLSGTLPSGVYMNFTLESEQTFQLVLDRVPHNVTLRKDEVFEDELRLQLQALAAAELDAAAGQALSLLNYANTTFLIQSTGVKRLETVTTSEFETLTGLSSDKTKAVLFTPVVRNLYFTADALASVTEINLEATLAVLEASSYGGAGFIELSAACEFGTKGETLTLGEVRDAIIDDPFSMVAANATIRADLEIDVTVSVPGLLDVTGGVAVSLTPEFFVELKENFTLPNSSNFVVTINTPGLPSLKNFKNLSLAEIVVLVGDGVDLLFGNAEEGTTGLLSDLPLLDTEIPVVSFTPREVVTEVQGVLETMELLLTNTSGSIHRLEDIVEEVLGLEDPNDDTDGCYKSCVVEFSYDEATQTLALQLQADTPDALA